MHKNTTSPLSRWPWPGLPTVREAPDNRARSRRFGAGSSRDKWLSARFISGCSALRPAHARRTRAHETGRLLAGSAALPVAASLLEARW
jgi:hypothetical protein